LLIGTPHRPEYVTKFSVIQNGRGFSTDLNSDHQKVACRDMIGADVLVESRGTNVHIMPIETGYFFGVSLLFRTLPASSTTLVPTVNGVAAQSEMSPSRPTDSCDITWDAIASCRLGDCWSTFEWPSANLSTSLLKKFSRGSI
jgi:hypothetical protein